MACDVCDGKEYTEENPFVQYRTQRPSDHSCMTCTFAGHKDCICQGITLPCIGSTGGYATGPQWEEWIESEGRAKGCLFLD